MKLTPAEQKKNCNVPVRKALPAKKPPVVNFEDEVYDSKGMISLIRLLKKILKQDTRYKCSVRIQECDEGL